MTSEISSLNLQNNWCCKDHAMDGETEAQRRKQCLVDAHGDVIGFE